MTRLKYILLFLLFVFLLLRKRRRENYHILENHSFYDQSFTDKEVKKTWNHAHSGLKKHFNENGYITFDTRFKVKAKRVIKPGKLYQQQPITMPQHVSNLNDVLAAVKTYKSLKVKASGGHHTFNDMSLTSDLIIRTFNLKNIIDIDYNQKTVHVEAGILLGELNNYLEQHHLALPALPAIPFQCLGGALATSTHGSTQRYGTMSNRILEMTFILPNNTVKTFTRTDPEFEFLKVHLGAFGILYSVKLQCVKLFGIDHTRLKVPLKDALKNLDSYLKEYDYFQMYVRPEPKLTTLYLRKSIPASSVTKQMIDKYRHLDIRKTNKKIDYAHRVLTKNMEASFYTEIEIGVDKKYFQEALKTMLELYKRYNVTDYPILIRYTRRDTMPLSLTGGRDTVFFDTFQQVNKFLSDKGKTEQYFREFHDTFIHKFYGRPHYGKQHWLTKDLMERIYSKKIIKYFNEVRKQIDPYDRYKNAYINRLFG